jgi:hypothetical protein
MEDIKDLANKVQKDLQNMLNLLEVNMAKINAEDIPEITQARVDMKKVMEGIRKGDSSEIDKIIKKYGGINR